MSDLYRILPSEAPPQTDELYLVPKRSHTVVCSSCGLVAPPRGEIGLRGTVMLSGGSAASNRSRSIQAYPIWCYRTLRLRHDTAVASLRVTVMRPLRWIENLDLFSKLDTTTTSFRTQVI